MGDEEREKRELAGRERNEERDKGLQKQLQMIKEQLLRNAGEDRNGRR